MLTSPGFPFLRSPESLGVVGRSKLMWDPTTVGAVFPVSTKPFERKADDLDGGMTKSWHHGPFFARLLRRSF